VPFGVSSSIQSTIEPNLKLLFFLEEQNKKEKILPSKLAQELD